MSININDLRLKFEQALDCVKSVQELFQVESKFLGKDGIISAAVKSLPSLAIEERKIFGQSLNSLKETMVLALRQKEKQLGYKKAEDANKRDSLWDGSMCPEDFGHEGKIHILSRVCRDIKGIMTSMGFSVADGPELENDFYNFKALNIPEGHPARDMFDTMWTNVPGLLLRTHTSSVQIHTLESKRPPIATTVVGRVSRHEATDATHEVVFHQCEGVVVDKNISLGHLFGVAKAFFAKFFDKKDVAIRIRPSFYPFVVPGVDIDCECVFCKNGCSICKGDRWIELMGAGLIHPNVLKAVSIDPSIYSGFAWGFGVERLAMLKYGINDVRLFHGGDIRFLQQF